MAENIVVILLSITHLFPKKILFLRSLDRYNRCFDNMQLDHVHQNCVRKQQSVTISSSLNHGSIFYYLTSTVILMIDNRCDDNSKTFTHNGWVIPSGGYKKQYS